MWVIDPMPISDAEVLSSSIPETDHPEWDALEEYAVGERVIVVSTHKVYQAAAATVAEFPPSNLYDPDTSPSGKWIELGATERWKAFDGVVSDLASETTDITYTIEAASLCNGVALFGLVADWVRLKITDPAGPTVVHDETRYLQDPADDLDPLAYPGEQVRFADCIFSAVPGEAGCEIEITIGRDDAGTRRLGEIVVGREIHVGQVLTGASAGIIDYSRRDVDDFGRSLIVRRSFADTVTFPVAVDARRINRIVRYLAVNLRAVPAVYHAGADSVRHGLCVYGFFKDLPVTVETGEVGFLTLEIEGLP